MSFRAWLSLSRETKTVTLDANVYPPETNKIATLGRIKARKVCVVCNGKGSVKVQPLDIPAEVERWRKLRDAGTITDEEFEQQKKELMG